MAKAKRPARKRAKKPTRKPATRAPQSIKSVLTKSALVAHLADAAKVAAFEDAIQASISKQGAQLLEGTRRRHAGPKFILAKPSQSGKMAYATGGTWRRSFAISSDHAPIMLEYA